MPEDLFINMSGSIKALSPDRSGGYAILFTSPQRRDLHRQYFTSKTYYGVDPLIGKRIMFMHGMDKQLGTLTTAYVDVARFDDKGLWIEFADAMMPNAEKHIKSLSGILQKPADWLKEQLELYKEYRENLRQMREQGILKFSSGALPQSVDVDENPSSETYGFIKSWEPIEFSEVLPSAHPDDDPQGTTRIYTLKSFNELIGLSDKEAQNDTSDNHFELAKAHNQTTQSQSLTVTRTNKMELSPEQMQAIEALVAAFQAPAQMAIADDSEIKASGDAPMEDEEDVVDKAKSAMVATAKRLVSKDSGVQVDFDANIKTAVNNYMPEIIGAYVETYVNERSKKQNAMKQAAQAAILQAKKSAPGNSLRDTLGAVGNGTGNRDAIPNTGGLEHRKYANLSANDMQFGYMVAKAFNPMSKGLSNAPMGTYLGEDYLKAMVAKSAKSLDTVKDFKDLNAIKSAMPFKADEINASDIVGFGDEWVGVNYSSNLLEKARYSRIFQSLTAKGMMEVEVPQGHESTYVLTEGSDPTFYSRQQANDNAGSGNLGVESTAVAQHIGTGRILLTPGELVALVGITDIATEDSLIPFIPQANKQMNEGMLDHIDKMMINADSDTSATTNINLIDGTPSSTITSKPYYLATNGFLKYALVTGPAASLTTARDGGSLTEEDFRLTWALMPGQLRARRDRIAFIIDVDTESTALSIPAIKTDDVRRTNATVTSGVLTNIYGMDVLTTGFMPLANSVGKVPAAGGTKGRILCVYAPYWAFGYKRQIEFKQDYDIYSATNLIAITTRFGMVTRGEGASTVTYNLTIA